MERRKDGEVERKGKNYDVYIINHATMDQPLTPLRTSSVATACEGTGRVTKRESQHEFLHPYSSRPSGRTACD